MNGFSLLLTIASLSVVYSWRTGVDQQQEYVLQIEPEIVQALSAGEEIFSDVPSSTFTPERFSAISAIDLFAETGLAKSKSEARRLISSGGAYINNERVNDEATSPSSVKSPAPNLIVLRSGKKNYHLVKVEG